MNLFTILEAKELKLLDAYYKILDDVENYLLNLRT